MWTSQLGQAVGYYPKAGHDLLTSHLGLVCQAYFCNKHRPFVGQPELFSLFNGVKVSSQSIAPLTCEGNIVLLTSLRRFSSNLLRWKLILWKPYCIRMGQLGLTSLLIMVQPSWPILITINSTLHNDSQWFTMIPYDYHPAILLSWHQSQDVFWRVACTWRRPARSTSNAEGDTGIGAPGFGYGGTCWCP